MLAPGKAYTRRMEARLRAATPRDRSELQLPLPRGEAAEAHVETASRTDCRGVPRSRYLASYLRNLGLSALART